MPSMSQVTKAILPVAGLGTRFLPATKAQPKEMLPLVDKPLIQYIVEEAVAAGIRDIIFVTSQTKRAIEDHFDRNFELEYRLREKNKLIELKAIERLTSLANFTYVRQKSPRGLGDAILTAEHLISGEPFAVLLGDDIIDSQIPAIKQLMDVYDKYRGTVLGVATVKKSQTSRYGIIRADKLSPRTYEVKQFVEKPEPSKAPSNLAVTGRYVLTPDIFPILRKTRQGKGGEIQITDAIASLIPRHKVYACAYQGTYYDCGSKLDYIKATINFGLQRKEIRQSLKTYIKQCVQA